LSLPLTADLEVRGAKVGYYFDNLLPDNPDIHRRLRARFQTRSSDAFDLLAQIGRDCVGAVQLLPLDEDPVGWNRIDAEHLSERDVEQTLRRVTSTTPLGREEQDDFRLSIAGAQEKTALLGMAGKWYRPHGATPTTHIFKLPLGAVGDFAGDLADSAENEWLCSQFLRALDLPVAHTAIATFGEQRAIVVTRFDRRWIGVDEAARERKRFRPIEGMWIARLPQEDFCQASGRPPNQKYEADGGPSITESLDLLANGEHSAVDRANFVLAQLVFWLLAAIDGHGKNFSIFHRVGGSYAMTPLYDVLSAWPVIGSGKNQLAPQRAKLAMALRGKNAHYRLDEIQARHWHALAERAALTGLWERMKNLVETAPTVLDRLEPALPASFPERVFATIRAGVRRQARRFVQTAVDRTTKRRG
jgi:serine/threonine-protein kinase HipA